MVADNRRGRKPRKRKSRSKELEAYVSRLNALERLAMTCEGVDKVFAIQAGREIRVILRVADAYESQAAVVAGRVAEKMNETESSFEITVTVVPNTGD